MYEYIKLFIPIVYNNVLYFYMETFAHFLYYMLTSHITDPHEELYFDCLI